MSDANTHRLTTSISRHPSVRDPLRNEWSGHRTYDEEDSVDRRERGGCLLGSSAGRPSDAFEGENCQQSALEANLWSRKQSAVQVEYVP